MSSWLVVTGAIGVVASVASLMGLALATARQGHWGMAFTCLGAVALVLILLLFGLEYADEFWKARR